MMGKMRDKIIIFDWGGVIESNVVEEYNIYVAISNIIKQCNIKMSEREFLNTLYKNNEICNNIENIEKWFQTLKLDCSFEEFLRIYKNETSKVYYYKEVVLLAQILKKYCNIAILSNIILLDKSRLKRHPFSLWIVSVSSPYKRLMVGSLFCPSIFSILIIDFTLCSEAIDSKFSEESSLNLLSTIKISPIFFHFKKSPKNDKPFIFKFNDYNLF